MIEQMRTCLRMPVTHVHQTLRARDRRRQARNSQCLRQPTGWMRRRRPGPSARGRLAVQRASFEDKAVPVGGAFGDDLTPDKDLRALRGRVHRLAFKQSDSDGGRAHPRLCRERTRGGPTLKPHYGKPGILSANPQSLSMIEHAYHELLSDMTILPAQPSSMVSTFLPKTLTTVLVIASRLVLGDVPPILWQLIQGHELPRVGSGLRERQCVHRVTLCNAKFTCDAHPTFLFAARAMPALPT